MVFMVVVGVLLIVVAVAAILGAVFLVDGSNIEYFGTSVPPITLFVAGTLSVVFIGLGLALMASGTKRNIRSNRDHKRLDKLNQQHLAENETFEGH